MGREMHLIAVGNLGPTAYNMGSWRHPGDPDFLDSGVWEDLAKTLEEAKFDALFFADGQAPADEVAPVERGGLVWLLDPVPVLTNVLRATTHLGVAATISTSFFEPYGLARMLGTIDYLSGGRLAWNVVTSSHDAEAQRYSMDHLPGRDARYARATEVLESCFQLWDSFPADAMVVDRKSGEFIDRSKLKYFEYGGEYVQTRGPLYVPQSPQGRPIIMQAGASDIGREFAASFADIIFMNQFRPEDMREQCEDMRRRLVAKGRSPDECKICPIIQVSVAETATIARERLDYVTSLIDQDAAMSLMTNIMGIEPGTFSPDEPLDALLDRAEPRVVGWANAFKGMRQARGDSLTIGDAARMSCSESVQTLVGSPEQVADQLEDLFERSTVDGFVVDGPVRPGSMEDFCRMVVPILQERGLFRSDYPGTTFRDTLQAGVAA
jgi:FMN-dependent oxidoreductase (nitrilotriacetate monooxygenase family)